MARMTRTYTPYPHRHSLNEVVLCWGCDKELKTVALIRGVAHCLDCFRLATDGNTRGPDEAWDARQLRGTDPSPVVAFTDELPF